MHLKATDSTPEVDLRFIDGKGSIKGKLAIGRLAALFQQIEDHLDSELQNHQGRTFLIEIELEQIPSVAIPHVRRLLDKLKKHLVDGKAAVSIDWYYDKNSRLLRNEIEHWADLYHPLLRANLKTG